MNALETQAIKILKTLEWKTHREKKSSDAIIFKERGDEQLQAIIQIRQLPSQQNISLSVSVGSKELTQIIGSIRRGSAFHEGLIQTQLTIKTDEITHSDVQCISNKAMEWWHIQDVSEAIRALTLLPPATGSTQLKHLASLAYSADFNTLFDYKSTFQRGKRLNFVPMITPEMVDRALHIAFERS